MNFKTLMVIPAAFLLTACGGGDGGVNEFSAPENTPVAKVFESGCAKCHGVDGGGKMAGMMYKMDPAGRSAEELAALILSGQKGMPSFPKLSETQRLSLAKHVIELRK